VAVIAVQSVRRMRGGAQSQLMLGADGASAKNPLKLWVVKFQNNPQHLRVLANEMIATRIAAAVGLSVPKCDVVEVSEWLVRHSPEMTIELGRDRRERCAAGLQFGCEFVGGLMPGQVVDYLPDPQMEEVKNLAEFAGILALDKWTGNCNGRQAVFERRPRERKYRAIFIDQGYCFNAGEWTFPDSPLRGVFARNLVYKSVRGWDAFEPWLERIENFPAEKLGEIAESIPPAWYGGDPREIERLMETLLERRSRVRELIGQFRDSNREPFPKWGAMESVVVPRGFEEGAGAPKFVM